MVASLIRCSKITGKQTLQIQKLIRKWFGIDFGKGGFTVSLECWMQYGVRTSYLLGLQALGTNSYQLDFCFPSKELRRAGWILLNTVHKYSFRFLAGLHRVHVHPPFWSFQQMGFVHTKVRRIAVNSSGGKGCWCMTKMIFYHFLFSFLRGLPSNQREETQPCLHAPFHLSLLGSLPITCILANWFLDIPERGQFIVHVESLQQQHPMYCVYKWHT